MARCPECGAKLSLAEDLERWDRIYCEACHAELEVLSLKPLELEAVYDFEEDGLLDDLDDEDFDDLDDLDELEWDDEDEEEEKDDDNERNDDW
ncbi:MAG: hypothetical protein ACP5JG_11380 [Anaerolineae bacterium]